VVQRVAKKYRVQVRVGGKLMGHVWTSKADAEREERELKREQELTRSGLERPRDQILILDYAGPWLRRRERALSRASTDMDDSRLRKYILPPLGARPMQTIRTQEIRDLLDTLQEEHKLSNATRNRIRALLHTLFQDAFMDEKIVANPVARVPLLVERPERPKPLTRDELEKLLSKAGEHTFLILTLIYSGGRVSQVAALQNRDFDLSARVLHFVRKYEQASHRVLDGIKGRPDGVDMPLFPVLHDAFLTHIQTTAFRRPNDFCFPRPDGRPRSTLGLRATVKRLCRVAGIRVITPHVLRATFATLAEEAGYSKEDVQRMLGHSSVQVTQRYTRRSVAPLIEKGDRLGFGSTGVARIRKKRG
jgi:integrase